MKAVRAGCGEAVIYFSEDIFPTPHEGYTGVHDDPYARAFIFETEEERYAVIALDLVNYSGTEELADAAARVTGTDRDHVLIHCNHSLATPHGAMFPKTEEEFVYGRRYTAIVTEAVKRAAADAAERITEVTVGYGTAVSNVNVNRVIRLGDCLWQGTNEAGPSDHTVPVVVIRAASDETVLGIMYSVNMANGCLENSRLADGSRPISADLAGVAAGNLKEVYPDAVCAYFIGASGDQWQELRAVADRIDAEGRPVSVDLSEQGFAFAEGLGTKLASSVTAAVRSIVTHPVTKISLKREDYTYPAQVEVWRTPEGRKPGGHLTFVSDGECRSDMTLLSLENICFLAIHPEIDVETLGNIRNRSGVKNLFLMEFTNGDGGYMARKENYDGCGYQCRKSRFARGSAEIFEENAVTFLKNR